MHFTSWKGDKKSKTPNSSQLQQQKTEVSLLDGSAFCFAFATKAAQVLYVAAVVVCSYERFPGQVLESCMSHEKFNPDSNRDVSNLFDFFFSISLIDRKFEACFTHKPQHAAFVIFTVSTKNDILVHHHDFLLSYYGLPVAQAASGLITCSVVVGGFTFFSLKKKKKVRYSAHCKLFLLY